ncbi:TerB family tellurite resistance protein [Thiosocius teredinicola]|uniref:TerB family tellurite resistance protein n=1 Tax=Thiosocius teredinicola TaxID=1973002 RepID=UPI000990E661
MHILLGILGTTVTILILLNRLAEAGFDLGGLNPFLWHRRRKWKKQYNGNPVFKIASPMDATAILMVAAAKADGDISKEDKSLLLDKFENDFSLSKKDAAGLLISSAHLLGDGTEVRSNVRKFLAPSVDKFTPEQIDSAMALISAAAGKEEDRHPNAVELLADVRKSLQVSSNQPAATW